TRTRPVSTLVEVGDHLSVSQGTRRGDAVTQAHLQQSTHLADEAIGEHLVGPLRQPRIKTRCVPIQSDDRPVPTRRTYHRRRRGERLSRELDDLQRPHDAAAVGWLYRGSSVGV